MKARTSALILAAAFLSACGGEPPAGSCVNVNNTPGSPVCVELWEIEGLLEAGDRCEGLYDGSWLDGPRCPTAGRVGRCESLSGDGMPLQSIVSYQPLTTIEAQSACVDGGTFYEE